MDFTTNTALRRIDLRRVHDLRKSSPVHFQDIGVGPICVKLADLLFPHLHLGNRCIAKKQKSLALILANQITAWKKQRPVAVSRRQAEPGVRLRCEIFDRLVDHDVLICRKGSNLSGCRSLYDFTVKARRWLQQFDLSTPGITHYRIKRPTDRPPSQSSLQLAPVVLRNERKEAMEFVITPDIEALEDRILAINEYLVKHNYVFQREFRPGRFMAEQPLVGVRSIFNRDFRHGGRLYSATLSGYQAMTKKERSTLTIDGKSCVEYDFSGFQTRLLYHKLGIDCAGDVYKPLEILEGVEIRNRETPPANLRNAVKRATNTCLNAKSRGQANSSVSKWYRDHFETAAILWGSEIGPVTLVDRILAAHKPLKSFFFSQIGARLNATDDLPLMLDMLERFQRLDRPALGLHDAIITTHDLRQQAREIMVKCYRKKYGFSPVIKRSF